MIVPKNAVPCNSTSSKWLQIYEKTLASLELSAMHMKLNEEHDML
jgi:hypothetical protein